MLLERERQQTMMSLVNDEAFVFHTEFSEESSGGLKGGQILISCGPLESLLWGWSISEAFKNISLGESGVDGKW